MRFSARSPKVRQERSRSHAKVHAVPLVRQPGRGGRALLHVPVQGFEGPASVPLRRGRSEGLGATLGLGDDRAVPAGGTEFVGLNGGPHFKFSEAISFMVNCDTQAEIDDLWEKLSEGGEKGPCGWLKDKYGLSWQIVPTVLGEMMQDKDPKKTERVMAAVMQMKKLDAVALKRAYEQK